MNAARTLATMRRHTLENTPLGFDIGGWSSKLRGRTATNQARYLLTEIDPEIEKEIDMLTTTRTRRPSRFTTFPAVRTSDPFFNLVDRFFDNNYTTVPTSEKTTGNGWVPAVDIAETGSAFVATVDLPGLNKDAIELSIENNVLTLKGERSFESDDETTVRRRERAFGSFQRAFTLPTDVDSTKVEATFRDGVLTLTMPKSEAAKPRTIEISG